MQPVDPHEGMKREVGGLQLLLAGLSAIIGSGWLFGAWRAAGLAGPGATWAWLIGAIIVTTIALTYAELGAMYPEPGGMVRYSHYTHGSLLGFISGWANWMAVISVIPVEAEASAQYMASWRYQWARDLYVQMPAGRGELTASGLAIAAALVVVYFLFNYWGVRLFARSNAAITVFKLVVPVVTAVALMASGFHTGNFTVPLGEAGALGGFSAVLTAVATAGIVFSFNGFQAPVNLAGEARNPARDVPIAIVGSILIAAVIYVLLQVAYIGAVPPELLGRVGWHGIDMRSPFAELALLLNLNSLALLLYFDAFVSPSGTGITNTAITARMIYGMERNGTLPRMLGRVDARYGVPRAALWFDLGVAYIFLFTFRGWGTLAAVISVATIVAYLTGPVSALVMRRVVPGAVRPLRVPALPVISALAFVFATELLYWARWPLTAQIILLVMGGLPIYIYYQIKSLSGEFRRHLKGAIWFMVYMPVVAALSWAGSEQFGGRGYIAWGWDLWIVAAVGLIFFIWGERSGWATPALLAANEHRGLARN